MAPNPLPLTTKHKKIRFYFLLFFFFIENTFYKVTHFLEIINFKSGKA